MDDSGLCAKCDWYHPDLIICTKCIKLDYCLQCNYGYRLEITTTYQDCMPCMDQNCFKCPQSGDKCTLCRPNFYPLGSAKKCERVTVEHLWEAIDVYNDQTRAVEMISNTVYWEVTFVNMKKSLTD